MSRDPLAAMENLDGARRDPHPHRLAQERVRHGVVMPLDFDVVIEADLAFLPFRVEVRFDRQLLERRTLKLVEQRTPAPSRCRVTRSLSCATSSRMAALISSSRSADCAVWR